MLVGLALDKGLLITLVIYLVPMILSLTVHEYAHAWMAYRLGDDTAAREGRLSLSPVVHIDPIGTLLIPIINIWLSGFSMIGWAKPVPFNPLRFRRSITMRKGAMLVAAAGPVSNLLLALLAIGGFAIVSRVAPLSILDDGRPSGLVMLLRALFIQNVGLCLFNLLPIPPLDGSRLLPRSMDGLVAAISPYSFMLVLVILNVPLLRAVLFEAPVQYAAWALETLFRSPLWATL